MRSCLCVLVVLTFLSCSVNHRYEFVEKVDLEDFVNTQKLGGQILTFDSLIMNPADIHVIDSLLLLVDSYDNRHVQLYNLKTKKKIGSRVFFGQGPNDMLQPIFVKNDKKMIQLYDMATSYLFEYDVNTFVNNESPTPLNKIKLEKRPINSVEVLNNRIYGYSCMAENQMFVFDAKKGNTIREMIEFPQSNIPYSHSEKINAYYMNFTTNGIDKIVVCYSMTDLISIYDLNGVLLKRLHGPGHFFSYFKEIHNGNVVTSLMDRDKNRDAYFCPENVGERFFVLYDGEKVNAPEHDSLCDYLYSFTWDGDPNVIYELSEPIFDYTVDVNARKIYGISNNPEYHVVEFSY